MYWTECLVCRSRLVSRTRPRTVVSFNYDIRGDRKGESVRSGAVCPDCEKCRFSFGAVQVVVACSKKE